MRKLNKKQKDLILNYFLNDKLDYTNAEYNENKFQLKRECENINDYETLYTDINRLLDDIMFADNKEEIKELIARA